MELELTETIKAKQKVVMAIDIRVDKMFKSHETSWRC